MKVAHVNKNLSGTLNEQLAAARLLEATDMPKAIKAYEQILKKNLHSAIIYNRLMILYRKLKDPKSEIRIIDAAIKSFSDKATASQKQFALKIRRLSGSIGKITGLIDKKGVSTYDPEPIAGWKRRKHLLLQRSKTKKVKSSVKSIKKKV